MIGRCIARIDAFGFHCINRPQHLFDLGPAADNRISPPGLTNGNVVNGSLAPTARTTSMREVMVP
jgi:hypothetical protein